MFALPPEELQRDKLKFEEKDSYNTRLFEQTKSDLSDEDFQRASLQDFGQQNSNLTKQTVQFFNNENAEMEPYLSKSQSQPQFRTQQGYVETQHSLDRQSQHNDSVHSGSDNPFPKYSPVRRSNPNQKYIPTYNFVNGEGTMGDLKRTQAAQQPLESRSYQQELLDQIEEKRRKKEEEKRKLKEEELMDEERVKREMEELQRKELMEKEGKKKRLGDIMDRYNENMAKERRNSMMLIDDNTNGEQQRQIEPPRPIGVEQPPGAKYAQYRPSTDQDYDYNQDYEKFDILNRGHRAAVSGVPRAKLISDIGHDLKQSISNEVSKIRTAIKSQQLDFQDQLSKITREAQIAVEERDRVKNHLVQLQTEMKRKREEQMMQENQLMKVLNKYSLEQQRFHYPQRHVHIEHTVPKPEEKKTIYEKIFFDKISNVVESEKLNPPLNLYREATKNPMAQITIGQGQYYSNSKGALNTQSTLVTLDNKQLYPSKSLYELPDLQTKTTIVNWNKEPYEHYNHRVKDLHPRDERYFIRNNYESKYASKIGDDLNFKRYNLPEREEHKPQYDSRIRPIDLASINIEKIHQVNEQRLTRLDNDSRFSTKNGSKPKTDMDMITELLSLKL